MNCLTSGKTLARLLMIACLLCLALLSNLLHVSHAAKPRAQDLDDVSFNGTVRDEHGALVRGASVTVVHAATGTTRATETDDAGRYRFVELAPGLYTLRAAREGFAVAEKTGLETVAGQSVRLDFTLRPADLLEESVTVTEADSPPVDITRTVTGGTITGDELERLPLPTREALDLVLLLGGVTEEPLSTRDAAEDRAASGRASIEPAANAPEEAGTFALAGGPAYSNNITIDGLDNNDDRAARERFQPPLESVEEVQVVTNQFSAEYGRASGGRVNIRTRSGSKQFRGRLFHFFRDEALNANTWNNNRRGLSRLPLQEHVSGFSLSGPLLLSPERLGPLGYDGRRRTFFFVSHEYRTQLDSTLIDALVPVEHNPAFPLPSPTALAGRRTEPSATEPNRPAELAPFIERVSTPLRRHALTARLDHRFSRDHDATLSLQFGHTRNLRQFGGGLRLADSLQGRTHRTEAVSFTGNSVFSSSVVNQLRAQFSRLLPATRARDASASSPVVLISMNDPLDDSDPLDRSGTLVAGSSTAGATARRETRFQLQNTLTVVRGVHTLKLGADLQRIRSVFTDLRDATGTYNFTSAGDFLANSPSRFRQRFHTGSTRENTYAGIFIQDEWRPHRNITLSAGLRYERESALKDGDNFGPRLGAAFDPTGSGKTVVRAGAGLFYNRVLLRTLDDFTLGSNVVEFDTDRLPPAERRAYIAAHLRFPGALSPGSPQVRELGFRRTDFFRRLDPALRTPESYQMNVGVERELRGLVLKADYTFNRGIHLWREFNANAPRLPAGFSDFTEYLLSRDFPNFRDASSARPIYNASAAGELVRFTLAPPAPSGADSIGRAVEFGVPVSVFNLNSINSTTTLEAALAALQNLRPDPSRGQVEQLASVGNSFYHGLTVEARRRFRRAERLSFSLRAAYTLSRLIDDGVVNTSSALRVGDFRSERAPSLLDRRHRLNLSGAFTTPRSLGRVQLAAVMRLASGAPFNITIGGSDRNLDDVGNDRPDFKGDLRLIRSRRPGRPLDPRLPEAFSPPAIGRTGNLPRNAGRGPAHFTFDVNLTREFRLGERTRLRPTVEISNVLNKTVFTFGAEFVNFNALRPGASALQRQAFEDGFLTPTRTLRPREVRAGLRFDF